MQHFNFKNTISLLILCGALITTEGAMAQKRAPWVAPPDAAAKKNPLAGNPAVMPEAKKLYETNCSPCHGMKGKGDGAAAAGLTTKPADHSSVAIQSQTDGTLFWMITEGRNPMPTYKVVFTEKQRWELVNYIRTLAVAPKTKK